MFELVQEYKQTVPYDALVGQDIVRVFATDEDLGDNAKLKYYFDTTTEDYDYFAIDAHGFISLQKQLDFSMVGYNLSVW